MFHFILGEERGTHHPVIPSTLAVPSVSVALLYCFQHGAHWGGLVNTKSSLSIVQLLRLKCGQCFFCLLTSFGRSSKRWAGLCPFLGQIFDFSLSHTYISVAAINENETSYFDGQSLNSPPTAGNCPSTLFGMFYTWEMSTTTTCLNVPSSSAGQQCQPEQALLLLH